MVDQLARPTDRVDAYFFCEQPNSYITNEDLEKHDATRLMFPNSYFDPQKAHVLYNQYHEIRSRPNRRKGILLPLWLPRIGPFSRALTSDQLLTRPCTEP